ncbi:MAG: hypothetical protein DI582_04250 [Azospirillum brasilense]|nr:MAG: hypothetical protein DI582_04250 [Azospirillum brasilense]
MAAAKPMPVRVEAALAPGRLQLEPAGEAMLAGVLVLDEAAWNARAPGMVGDALMRSTGTDRYGAPQVVLTPPGQKRTLQEQLLGDGVAVLYDRAASPAAWKKAEAAARRAKKGVWGEPSHWRTPDTLSDALGQFVLMQGRITRTYKGRDMWYLNFGEDWKQDASLRIPRRAWRSMGKDFAVQQSDCVTARGVVFLDNGPMIEITRPEQMQIIPCQ